MGESEIDEVGVIATSWWYASEEKFNVEKSAVCIGSQEMGSDVPATCSLPNDCHVICSVMKQVRLRSALHNTARGHLESGDIFFQKL
jgi:hypothetical protein